jgi:hypothetical protein
MTTKSISDLPKLPQRPSALIRLACDDAEKVFRTPGYKLNMVEWHTGTDDGTCHVCFAGAVMAGTLGAPKGTFRQTQDFGVDQAALRALNSFRTGAWDVGVARLLGRETLSEPERSALRRSGVLNITIPPANRGTKGVAFIRAMRKAAKALESVGW